MMLIYDFIISILSSLSITAFSVLFLVFLGALVFFVADALVLGQAQYKNKIKTTGINIGIVRGNIKIKGPG